MQVLLTLDNIVLGSFLKNSSLQPNKCQNVVYIIFQHDFIEIVPTIKANTKMFEWAITRDEFSATFLSLSSAMKSSFSRAEIFCITSESANNLNLAAQQTKVLQQTEVLFSEHSAFCNPLINSDNDCDAPSGFI